RPGPLPADVRHPAAAARLHAGAIPRLAGLPAADRAGRREPWRRPRRPAGVLHGPAHLAATARHRQPAHLPFQVPLAAAGANGPRRRRSPPSHTPPPLITHGAMLPAPAPASRRAPSLPGL